MRGIKRWGSGEILERTYASMTPMLAHMVKTPWYQIFDCSPDAEFAEVEKLYIRMRRATHPDKPNGDEEAFKRASEAWEDFRNSRS
jgi:hypothetical protein